MMEILKQRRHPKWLLERELKAADAAQAQEEARAAVRNTFVVILDDNMMAI